MVLHLSSTNQKKGALTWIALIKLAYSLLRRNQGLPESSSLDLDSPYDMV